MKINEKIKQLLENSSIPLIDIIAEILYPDRYEIMSDEEALEYDWKQITNDCEIVIRNK